MSREKKHLMADQDIQVILGTLLRVGVICSMLIVFAGGVIYLVHDHSGMVDYRKFNAGKSGLASIALIFDRAGRMDGAAIIQLGTLLLIFTPILRVVFSIFSFLIERDYLYVLIGMFVLCVILFSLSNRLVG